MKKTIYLLAPLMLVSCNGTTPSQDVKFLIQESSVTLNDKTIVIHLDWEPSSDIIEFSNFSFTLKNQSDITSTVTLKDASARPLELTNTFNQTLENDDTGSLTFHYHDKTIMKEGEGNVDNILIKLDEPSKDVKFSIEESSLTLENQSTTLHLDWEPSSDVIEFNDFNFMLKNQSDITSTVTSKESTTRPLELTVTFNSELRTDDIAELTFHYHDKTIKKEGEGKVENININLPTYVEKPIKIVTTDDEDNTLEITHKYDESYRLIKSESKKYEKDKLTQDSIAQYTYNDHDDVTHFVLTIDNEEKINCTDTYEYDKNGNVILDRSKGSYYGVVTNTKDTYQYDEFNRVILHECYSADTLEDEPEMIGKYEYTYTEGKQYQEFEKEVHYSYYEDPTWQNPYETTNQTFDDKGDLTSTIILDENSVEIYKTTYTFNEYHCLTHRIQEEIEVSKTDYTASYYKNNPDKPLKTIEKFYDLEEGEKLTNTYTTTYTYDSHDRIKTETLDEDGSIRITTYYYELE